MKPNTYLSDIVTDFPEHQLSNLEKIKANEIEQLIYEKGLNIERRKMYLSIKYYIYSIYKLTFNEYIIFIIIII